MTKPRLILYGSGGHAKVVADIVRLQDRYELVGCLDDRAESIGQGVAGLPLLGCGQRLGELKKKQGITHALVAIGHNGQRLELSRRLMDQGLELATAIHPSAVVASGASLQPGTVVAAMAVVNPDARLGISVIVNTSASVDHDGQIADAVHIAPGAHLSGEVSVGQETWIGLGALVRQRIAIGRNCFVAAGAVVVKDIADGWLAMGVPARCVRQTQGHPDDSDSSTADR